MLFVFQANLRQLVETVDKNDTDKASKLTTKGLDPNFIDSESGGK